MKYVIVAAVLSFAIVFLAFPTEKDGMLGGCNDIRVFEGYKDCAPRREFGLFGGGVLYLKEVVTTGQLKQADYNNYTTYEVGAYGDATQYFHPVDALKAAVIGGVVGGAIVYAWQRIRRNK